MTMGGGLPKTTHVLGVIEHIFTLSEKIIRDVYVRV